MKEKADHSSLSDESLSIGKNLVLYNDDVNSFDFVIDTLIEVCDHDTEQAEQCTLIAHYKGKCNVKSGDYYELNHVCNEMNNRGLTVEIK